MLHLLKDDAYFIENMPIEVIPPIHYENNVHETQAVVADEIIDNYKKVNNIPHSESGRELKFFEKNNFRNKVGQGRNECQFGCSHKYLFKNKKVILIKKS